MATGTTGTSGGGFMRSTLISLAAWTPGNSWTEMALAMLAVAVCKAAAAAARRGEGHPFISTDSDSLRHAATGSRKLIVC